MKVIEWFAIVLVCLFVNGCIFAPNTYGPRGIVISGSSQYQKYLDNCRQMSESLNEACQTYGNPALINIGARRGVFLWENPRLLYTVGSFGSTKVLTNYPQKYDMYFVRAGLKIEEQLAVNTPGSSSKTSVIKAAPSYVIDRMEKLSVSEFAYSFELTADCSLTLALANRIKEDMRRTLLADYAQSHKIQAGVAVQTDFSEFTISKNKISGCVAVRQLKIVALDYDANTHKGVVRVKMEGTSLEMVRSLVRRNIENIVKDKNIVLVTGEIPPDAHFFLGDERVVDGNIYEMEFEAQ